MHLLRKSLKLITIFFLMVFIGVQGILLTHTHSLPKAEVATGHHKTSTFEIHAQVSHCLVCDFMLQKLPQNKTEVLSFTFALIQFFKSSWSVKQVGSLSPCSFMERQGRAPPENPFS